MTTRLSKLALPLLMLAPLAAQDDLMDTGPMSLVIQYHCVPSRRAQLRQAMTGSGLAQLDGWKTHGILADYRVLFSRYADTDRWDMLALLSFRKYDDVLRWGFVERRSPAGLPAEAAEWLTGVESYPADLVREKAPPPVLDHPVYLVVPYRLSSPAAYFLTFVDGYERPQLDAWTAEGILAGYGFYMQRYTAGRPWDSLAVLEFKDDLSLGAREKTAAKVRQALQSDQGWQQWDRDAGNARVEQAAVIADELGRDR
jgi:hypothetical protein